MTLCRNRKSGISTHDLTRRSTSAKCGVEVVRKISTHDLTRRSTVCRPTRDSLQRISTHDLTRRSTHFKCHIHGFFIFQLTTSQGGRRFDALLLVVILVFQLTTSQGGRHFTGRQNNNYMDISTHDLTRRSTSRDSSLVGCRGISTHDLTRRSTETIVLGELHIAISTHDLTRRST